MMLITRFKLFETVSQLYVDRKKSEGCHIVGYQTARRLWYHIGEEILYDNDQEGILKGITTRQRGRIVKYYGIIEIKRGEKKFTSLRLVTSIQTK